MTPFSHKHQSHEDTTRPYNLKDQVEDGGEEVERGGDEEDEEKEEEKNSIPIQPKGLSQTTKSPYCPFSWQ